MRHWYSPTDILVEPRELWEFAWSEPMRDLAAKVGMSDVGLKKLLNSWGVVTPPQGHWNRVRAGRPTQPRPRVPERRPGETGRMRLDKRFARLLAVAPPLPSQGPFASKHVPEDLEDLGALELKAIGRASVPASLDRYHPGLNPILRREERRAAKAAESRYHWDEPRFANPVDRRRLRILSGVFSALAKRGHEGSADEYDNDIEASAMIGATYVRLELAVLGRHKSVLVAGQYRPDPKLPASTPLAFTVGGGRGAPALASWRDDEAGKLESKIAEIAAGIIVAGEASFRRRLREDEERIREQRAAEEQKRQERLNALNAQRIEDLKTSGELLRQSEAIRALVSQVKAAMGDSVNETTLVEWERWASAEADKLDPVKSGQINTHLVPPALD